MSASPVVIKVKPVPVSLEVNGQGVDALVEPRLHLGDFLRESQRLTGTHLGCEHGVCGACTVLIDGVPSRSCIAFAAACDGQSVRTIEGFEDDAVMAQLREAFSKYHALQCGFCTPGMLISARDLVMRLPDADEHRVRVEMSGNLCRCTGYQGITRAILSVLEARRATNDAAPAAPSPAPAAAFAGFQAAAAPAAGSTPVATPVATAPSTPSAAQGTRIEESFTVAHPLERVWAAFADMPRVAACLPGAEVTSSTADSLKGKVTTRLGPMKASFAGAASLERNESEHSGMIRGAGTDSLSGSRARGDIGYRLEPAGAGTKVTVSIDYSLQGPLAQFSRGGLVREFVRKMVSDFAANLDRDLSGQAPVAGGSASAPDAGGVFWSWLLGRIKALFGGRQG
jgi:carbon-monoxide dehydrogenase small subunit